MNLKELIRDQKIAMYEKQVPHSQKHKDEFFRMTDLTASIRSERPHKDSEQPDETQIEAADLIIGQSVRIKSLQVSIPIDSQPLQSQLKEKDQVVEELSYKLGQFNDYVQQVEELKTQISAMESVFQNTSQRTRSSVERGSQSQLATARKHHRGKSRSKMNIIDDDSAVEKMRISLEKKEKAVQNQRLKQNINIMSEMQNSLKKIETKVILENENTLQKLKARNKQLLAEKRQSNETIASLLKEVEAHERQSQQLRQRAEDQERQNQRLISEINTMGLENSELRKKTSSMRRELEIVPELREQLSMLKDTMHQLEHEMEHEKDRLNEQDAVTDMHTNRRSMSIVTTLQKRMDEYEAKNYDLLKENLRLKEDYGDLQEMLKKQKLQTDLETTQAQFIMLSLVSFLKRIDPYYEHEVTEELTLKEVTKESKRLLAEVESKVDEIRLNEGQLKNEEQLLQSRIDSLRDHNSSLQKKLEASTDTNLQHQEKIKSLEAIVITLRGELQFHKEGDKELERYKLQIKNHLLNIKHQAEQIQKTADSSRDYEVEGLLDYLNAKLQGLCLKERELKREVDQLQEDKDKLRKEMLSKMQCIEDFKNMKNHHSQELVDKFEKRIDELKSQSSTELQEKNLKLQQSLIIVAEKEDHIEELLSIRDILFELLRSVVWRVKELYFQKQYLDRQSRKEERWRAEIESLLGNRDKAQRKRQRPLRVFAWTVLAAVKLSKMLKQPKFGINLSQLFTNIHGVKHDHIKLFSLSDMRSVPKHRLTILEDIMRKLTDGTCPLKQILNSSSLRASAVEEVRQYVNNFQSQRHHLEERLVDNHREIERLQGALSRHEHENFYQSQSHDILRHQLKDFQGEQHEYIIQEKVLLTKQVGELQDQLRDTEQMYGQKVKYLKQDIELKAMQLSSMQTMLKKKEQEIRNLETVNQKSSGTIKSMLQQQKKDDEEWIAALGEKDPNYSFADKN